MNTDSIFNKSSIVSIFFALIFLYIFATIAHAQSANAACAPLSTTIGTATVSINVPADGTYRVWTRMMSPDGSADTVYLEIDDTTCGASVGGGTISANTWTWVDYQNGNSNDKVSTTLTQGTHSLRLIGAEAGVKIDRVLLLTDGCTPTGTGDNCVSSADTTAPTVSITQPSNGSNATGSVTITADANDDQTISAVDFFIDGEKVGTELAAPYEYVWDTTVVADGAYSLYAVARDAWNNATTSTSVNVNVVNDFSGSADITFQPTSGSFEKGDIFEVAINVDSGSDEMNAAQVRILYENTLLEYVSEDASTSSFDIDAPTLTSTSSVTVARGSTSSITGSQQLTKLTFKVIGQQASAPLTIDQVDTSVLDGGVALALSLGNANYTIVDTTAPTNPTNLQAVASSSEVSLTWNAASDASGIERYVITRNGAFLANVTTTAYTDSNISSGYSYSYTVKAYDFEGNVSGDSNTAVVAIATKPGDFNNNGQVNIQDLSVLLGAWNSSNAETDMNGDGITNIIDLSIFLSFWGT